MAEDAPSIDVDCQDLQVHLTAPPNVVFADTPVNFTDSLDATRWDSYVDNHADAAIYHRSEWRQIVTETFGKQTFYLSVLDDSGDMRGIFPLVRLKSRIFGDNLVSLPYCNYGGPLSDSPAIGAILMDEAVRLGTRLGANSIESRNFLKTQANKWTGRTDKVRMLLQLPVTPDELSQALGAKRRAQINRSSREKPEIRHGRDELIADFYAVFCRNMRDLGTPVYPRRFFDNIARILPNNIHVTVLYLASRPVAAAFLISYRDILEVPWAAALREHSRIAVNMRLYWEVLQFAIERNYSFFDFGRSNRDEGTYRFKKQWGAESHQLYWQNYSFGQSRVSSGPEKNHFERIAINSWKKLPLAIANFLGPRITSNLPW